MRLPSTMGEEYPGGSSVFQITFRAGPNSSGSPVASATPEPLGPRNLAHSIAGPPAANIPRTIMQINGPIMATLSFRQRLWRVRNRPHDLRELTTLQQLPPFAAASGDFVLRGADRLFRAAARFDGHQIAVAGRRDEAQHAIRLRRQLDQDHAAPRA